MKNNARHSVGDRVVALSSNRNELSQPRVKGKIYTVQSIYYCSGCGIQTINIGCNNPYQEVECTCGKSQDNMGLHWTDSREFAKLDKSALQNAVEEENYELASIIRDALKTEKV